MNAGSSPAVGTDDLVGNAGERVAMSHGAACAVGAGDDREATGGQLLDHGLGQRGLAAARTADRGISP